MIAAARALFEMPLWAVGVGVELFFDVEDVEDVNDVNDALAADEDVDVTFGFTVAAALLANVKVMLKIAAVPPLVVKVVS